MGGGRTDSTTMSRQSFRLQAAAAACPSGCADLDCSPASVDEQILSGGGGGGGGGGTASAATPAAKRGNAWFSKTCQELAGGEFASKHAGIKLCPVCVTADGAGRKTWSRNGWFCRRSSMTARGKETPELGARATPRLVYEPGSSVSGPVSAITRLHDFRKDPDHPGRSQNNNDAIPPASELRKMLIHASGCPVPSLVKAGRGTFRGRFAALPVDRKRKAVEIAAAVTRGALIAIMPEDPDVLLGALAVHAAVQSAQKAHTTADAAHQLEGDEMAKANADMHELQEQLLIQLGMLAEAAARAGEAVAATDGVSNNKSKKKQKQHAVGNTRRKKGAPTGPVAAGGGGRSTRGGTTAGAAAAATHAAQEATAASQIRQLLICGRAYVEQLLGKRPLERRPLLSMIATDTELTRTMVELLLGPDDYITEHEWQAARMHAQWPGKNKPVEVEKTTACRIPTAVLAKIIAYLNRPGECNVQRVAYGEKLVELACGARWEALDAVTRMKNIREITVEFLLEIDSEIAAAAQGVELNDLESERRCCEVHPDSGRRCLNLCAAAGQTCAAGTQHKWTPKGSMCEKSLRSMVETLTMGDMVTMAGIDDVYQLKGTNNFAAMRVTIRTLASLANAGPEETTALLKQVDDTEDFHKSDFYRHLGHGADFACQCLTCGFADGHDEGAGDARDDAAAGDAGCGCERDPGRRATDGARMQPREVHGRSCADCAAAGGLFFSMRDLVERGKARNPRDIETIETLDETTGDIEDYEKNFIAYRAHLALKRHEADFDEQELQNLGDDEILVVSDWKMKILAVYFRENQQLWFGKRGSSMLGFMVIGTAADGTRQVKFYMFFTDDGCQDEYSVACAKMLLYSVRCHHPWTSLTAALHCPLDIAYSCTPLPPRYRLQLHSTARRRLQLHSTASSTSLTAALHCASIWLTAALHCPLDTAYSCTPLPCPRRPRRRC